VKGEMSHLTDMLGKKAETFLEANGKDRPFCLSLSFKAPHVQDGDPRPFQPHPRFKDYYKTEEIPVPVTANPAAFRKLPLFVQNSENRVRWKNRFATYDMYRNSVKEYYRLITGVDFAIGKIVQTLKRTGLYANTVIVYTSDNGFFLGEHGLAGKWLMYEASIRVPMLIHFPRFPEAIRGTRRQEITTHLDIAPTLLELAGIVPLPEMQGKSLVPILNRTPVNWRQAFFYEHLYDHPLIPPCEGVRTGRWKYIRYTKDRTVHSPTRYEQLFDIRKDPHETTDLASDSDYRSVLADMRERWSHYDKNIRIAKAVP
jgi:arylsulfatase A-like enzyme